MPDPAVLNFVRTRRGSASPATGSHKMHEIESEEIICHALELPRKISDPALASPPAGAGEAAPQTPEPASAQSTAAVGASAGKQPEESKK